MKIHALRKRIWLIIVMLICIVGIGAGSFFYISKPEGCTICHEMQPFYTMWQTSTHRNVDCHSCHETSIQGLLLEVSSHFQGVSAKEIAAQPAVAPPTNEKCIACHSNILEQTPHNEYLKTITGDYACSTCHNDHTFEPHFENLEPCSNCHGLNK